MTRIRMHKTVILTLLCSVVVLLLLTVNFHHNAQLEVTHMDVLKSRDNRTFRDRASNKVNQAKIESKDELVDFIGDVEQYQAVGYFDYAQYKIARLHLNQDSNQYINLRSHKMNTNSSYNPKQLQFYAQLDETLLPKRISLSVKVKDKYGRQVPGCSFQTKMYFGDNFSRLALCSTVAYSRGGYNLVCPNYRSACYNIQVRFRFANYEQFQDEPRILPANDLLYNETHCNPAFFNLGRELLDVSYCPFSWTLHPNKTCDTLLIYSKPVTKVTAEEACQCANKFDDLYIIGTSHIRFFTDYLLKKCHGQNFTGIAHNHMDLQKGNVHYLAWVFVEQLHFEIQAHLQKWLDPDLFGLLPEKPASRRIAIWIQTGSWDFSKISYNFTMEHALPQFAETLRYIRSTVAKSDTNVDLRVISTTPMTDAWYRNNYAIGAFNAQQRDIVAEQGIDFTDVLSMELPCKDDLEGNHYFYRHNETFGGNVGENVYFGHFLPKVCK